jgi:hypothetical protein
VVAPVVADLAWVVSWCWVVDLGCAGLLIGLLRLWLIGSWGFDGCREFGWSVKKKYKKRIIL